ncbi:RHS repeat domain-containing protein [Snodgrassella sp. M0110]|uniref:RHS repeat domain-containing protein n=1 Tax=unclassified Snodgrassella TaxID=2625236 RepID=UPI00351AF447
MRKSTIYYLHTDLNGMPEGLTDEAGEIVWEYSYQLLGKLIQETEYISVQQKLQYQGLYLDREPDCITILSGTTISIQITLLPESIGLEDRLNLYKYVENPLIYINLLGLTGCNRKLGKNFKDDLFNTKVSLKII